MVNGLDGDGAVQNYFNSSMSQEMVYTTSRAHRLTYLAAACAWTWSPDGGNRSAARLRRLSEQELQGDNLTDDLKEA